MAYKAKAYGSDEMEGSFNKQYNIIYDYAHELLVRNPGSTIKVKVEQNDGEPIFKRFYACLKACKDNFLSCRPIIGLDGALLKGRHRGELLTAVARDANYQMLPLAYAILEVENKETWTWFMELLIEDLGGPEVCSSLTLISYQQKGLLPVVQDVVPRVAHKFCVRHLYSNFRKKFPKNNLKKLMWRASTTTHPQKWEKEMGSIKEVNQDAFRHLIVISPSWSAQRLFEVKHVSQSGDKFVVDIDQYSCSCRKWSINGIPCVHALAAMMFLNIDVEDYIPVLCIFYAIYRATADINLIP
ncbi:uncharacterized protein LOC124845084 [Vigna umbellata]|uniref:uncharacterized protein LOC124845084 n=1 Tax=Vigna umbellata TaxID=87088 RepID=UPI001F5E4BB7|nr:uncharacterized protein LOC124845084 [Vigna umbellata]